MASLTKVMILYCGQGMCTLVEVYDDGVDTHAPDHLVLVDCGGNEKWSDPPVAWITAKLKAQQSAGRTPRLDLVVVSHQDRDHVVILKKLQEAILGEGLNAECGQLFCGGAMWTATNRRTVEKFAESMDLEDDDIQFNGPYFTDYEDVTDRKDLGHLENFGDVYVRVLVSGLKLSKGPDDILRNASSAVVVVENGTGSVVLPGDATYHTMKKCNTILGSAAGPLLPPREGFEVPHHGALRTAVENYDAKYLSSAFNFAIVKTFAANLTPKRVLASAGPRNTHCHPVEEVIVVFEGNVLKIADHDYVSYVYDRPKSTKHDGWQQWNTKNATHTTVQQIDGTILWGHLEVRLTAPGLLRPEEVVRFHPIGVVGPDPSAGPGPGPWLPGDAGPVPAAGCVLTAPSPYPAP